MVPLSIPRLRVKPFKIVSIKVLFSLETTIAGILEGLRQHPNNVRFSDLVKLCDAYFGEPRQKGTSHRIYRTPWPGDPRVNIQNAKGKAKPYQVRQVIRAIEKLESMK